MTVRLYKSTDASAPTLTGQVGSLVALLDAVLVNGYGSKSAAGWTKAFSATNKASYRMVTSGNTGFYLDVDDSAPSSAREARMRGYEAMTAVGTGTNAFPTSAQSSFGVVCRKSTSADATARPWYAIADGSCIYLFIDTGDWTAPAYSSAFAFGDFFSYKSSDAYNCCIVSRQAENDSNAYQEKLGEICVTSVTTQAQSGCFLARAATGVAGSVNFGKFSSVLCGTGTTSGNGYCAAGGSGSAIYYPNYPDGGLLLAPLFIAHNGYVRGYFKGLWSPCHFQPCGHGDQINGTGVMSAKSFIALNTRSNSSGANGWQFGQLLVEYSDTWS